MSTASLAPILGDPIAKILLKYWLRDPSDEDLSGDLAQYVRKKFDDLDEQEEARWEFGPIGRRVAKGIGPGPRGPLGLLKSDGPDPVWSPVARALEGRVAAGAPAFFKDHVLDPELLTTALRSSRPTASDGPPSYRHEEYDRALERTVRFVVEAAGALPEYDANAVDASFRKVRRNAENLDKVLESVRAIEEDVGWRSGGETEEEIRWQTGGRIEADYRQAVIRNLDFVELFGANLAPESRRHLLSVAYVSLSLNEETGPEAGSLPAESFLDRTGKDRKRLLIRGVAGSGKSTLFRWAAIQGSTRSERHALNYHIVRFLDKKELFRGEMKKDPVSLHCPGGIASRS